MNIPDPLRLVVPGEPRPWTVWARRGAAPVGYERMCEYQDRIRVEAKKVMGDSEPWEGPVYLDFWFYRSLHKAPKTEPARSRWAEQHVLTRPDATNYRKAAEDACQGILVADDARVLGGWCEKWYSETAHTVIVMRAALDD